MRALLSADMELKVYFGGQSAELRDATSGAALAELELWPPDLCPRDRLGTTAEAIGMVARGGGDAGRRGRRLVVLRSADDRPAVRLRP
jgi:hypothetical protein